MSMRTFLLYVMDPGCKPESADYWVHNITNEGWKMITKDLHGGCLFAMTPPDQVSEGIESIFGIPFSKEQVLNATFRAHILGFALEQKQGITAEEYDMPADIFVGQPKGDLPGVHFLTRDLFEEIRERVLERLHEDVGKLGYGQYIGA
jgi:aldehyde:ferredoxin oxidoreductase